MGVNGSAIVERMIRGEVSFIIFVVSNCHFIFILLVVGSMVSAVEYARRM